MELIILIDFEKVFVHKMWFEVVFGAVEGSDAGCVFSGTLRCSSGAKSRGTLISDIPAQ